MKNPIFKIHQLPEMNSDQDVQVTERFSVDEFDKHDLSWWNTMIEEDIQTLTVGQTVFEIPAN